MSANMKWHLITTVVTIPSLVAGIHYPDTIMFTIPVISIVNFIHGIVTA